MDFKNLSPNDQSMVRQIESDIIGLMDMNNLSDKPNLCAIFMTIYAYYFLVEFYVSDYSPKVSGGRKPRFDMVSLEIHAERDSRIKIGNLIVNMVDQFCSISDPDTIVKNLFGVFGKIVSNNSFEVVSHCQQKAMAQTERFICSIGDYDYGDNPDFYLDKITVTLALDMQQKNTYELWERLE